MTDPSARTPLNGRVLMADDDPDDRDLVSLAFAELGWGDGIDFVENGAELLDRLRGRGRFATLPPAPPPALILLDLNMPCVDGREALAQIRADPALRRVPVVIMSTSQVREDEEECARLGATRFLTKPSTFDALVKLVASLAPFFAARREVA